MTDDEAAEHAHDIVWNMKLNALYDMSTGQASKDIEKSAELMIEMVTEQILDGQTIIQNAQHIWNQEFYGRQR